MKEKEKLIPLRIYNLSHSLMKTEIFSLLGDKYLSVLPEGTSIVSTPAEANVISWDGLMPAKFRSQLVKFIDRNKAGKVFLLTGEPVTLAENNQAVRLLKTENLDVVEVAGWNILPEELVAGLIECHKKINHV